MAGRGRSVDFHGAFGMKGRAKAKEKSLRRRGKEPYIQDFNLNGHKRYAVITRRQGK
jgi:hypothetical protein